MENFVEVEEKKSAKGTLVALIILGILFTITLVFSSSFLSEMFTLALLENRELGEGIGLALLLVLEIITIAIMLVLILISLIPFLLALKREKGKARGGSIAIFLYEAITIFLSIIAFVVLILLI